MRHTLKILSHVGDDTIAAWDPEVEEEVKLAEFQFERHATMLAFTDTHPAEQIKKFDPQHDIIMTPQIIGG